MTSGSVQIRVMKTRKWTKTRNCGLRKGWKVDGTGCRIQMCVFDEFRILKTRQGFSHFDSEPNHRSVCLLKERICRDLRLEMLWNPRFVRTRRKSNAFYFGENRCPANFNTQQCSIIMQSHNILQLNWLCSDIMVVFTYSEYKIDVLSSNLQFSSRISKSKYHEFSILLWLRRTQICNILYVSGIKLSVRKVCF